MKILQLAERLGPQNFLTTFFLLSRDFLTSVLPQSHFSNIYLYIYFKKEEEQDCISIPSMPRTFYQECWSMSYLIIHGRMN